MQQQWTHDVREALPLRALRTNFILRAKGDLPASRWTGFAPVRPLRTNFGVVPCGGEPTKRPASAASASAAPVSSFGAAASDPVATKKEKSESTVGLTDIPVDAASNLLGFADVDDFIHTEVVSHATRDTLRATEGPTLRGGDETLDMRAGEGKRFFGSCLKGRVITSGNDLTRRRRQYYPQTLRRQVFQGSFDYVLTCNRSTSDGATTRSRTVL